MQKHIGKGPEKCGKDIGKRAENGQKWSEKYWRMSDNRNECQIWINRMGKAWVIGKRGWNRVGK